MKKILKFFGRLGAIFLLSAVLAPLLFPHLPFKFERIFNRLVMIFTLTAVLLFVRVRREDLPRFGIAWDSRGPAQFLTAFLFSTAVLSGLLLFFVQVRYAAWAPHSFSAAVWVGKFALALGTALLVGILEEFFFRGFIFQTVNGLFKQDFRKAPFSLPALGASALLTNIFYSLLHFTSSNKPFIGPSPTFRDSLRLICAPFQSYGHWETLWPAALGLFLFGLVLTYLVLRSGTLYPAIGLHAGCIFFIKLEGSFADFTNTPALLLGSAKLYDGVIGWGVLILIGFILGKWIDPKANLKT